MSGFVFPAVEPALEQFAGRLATAEAERRRNRHCDRAGYESERELGNLVCNARGEEPGRYQGIWLLSTYSACVTDTDASLVSIKNVSVSHR